MDYTVQVIQSTRQSLFHQYTSHI